MEPMLHTPILPQNNFMYIELSAPQSLQNMNPLRMEIHTFFCTPVLKITSNTWQQTWNSGREEVQDKGYQE